ncbi:MAG: hypothetical protein QOJ91_1920 [Sphingomonadales bacterium]|nr:hypothetical protein [Sphingomonadales bacterium]
MAFRPGCRAPYQKRRFWQGLTAGAKQVAGHLQMVAKHRQLGLGERRRVAVAAPGLGLEHGDGALVGGDVEARQLAVEGSAP